jgi:molecular chaperone DnaJ
MAEEADSCADLYATLNVSRDASPDDIKRAFKRLAVENHPDKNQGCKDKEERFKSINQAYSVLSDPQKRQMYDQYGTADPAAAPPDLNEILRGMFGGGMPGMHGMPGMQAGQGGFNFVFMDGAPDIFEQIFGGGQHKREHPKNHNADIVEVTVDINDIHYGNNKRVEFDLLELCGACQGSGASDPSQVMKCITCKGKGEVVQQIGPFMNRLRCPSCSGNGSAIKRACTSCKAQKTVYNKKVFDLRLPKGIPNGHEVRMPGRGGYNVATKGTKDMVFKFKHDIQAPYSLDPHGNVLYEVPITIEELVGGFNKTVKLYRDDTTLASDRYFNPERPIVLKGKGIHSMQTGEPTDMHLVFKIEFVDSERLTKYKDIFHKIFKRAAPQSEKILDIHDAEK